MNYLFNCIQGIAIGSGAILPGISSGVFLVIFGIYEKFLNCILHFFNNPKKNFLFLLPYIIGIFFGILIFSNILNYFFINYKIQTKLIFCLLILSSVPKIIKETNKKVPFKIHYLVFTFIAFFIGLISVYLENYISNDGCYNFSFLYLFFAGFAMSIGVIVPGVSSTVILMLLGVYSVYLTSISSIYLPILFPIGLGLIFGGLIFMKLINYLLNNFYAQTFYSLIGFTLGSIFVLFPFTFFF